MFAHDLNATAELVLNALRDRQHKIVTAESCTGGLIAGALTSVPGSSDVVHGGYVTYANAAKINMLSVPQSVLKTFGAVSEQTARAMAEGARSAAGVDVAIAVTGVAGPDGGTAQKPIGLVHIACDTPTRSVHIERRFGDQSREKIRLATVQAALGLVLEVMSAEKH